MLCNIVNVDCFRMFPKYVVSDIAYPCECSIQLGLDPICSSAAVVLYLMQYCKR